MLATHTSSSHTAQAKTDDFIVLGYTTFVISYFSSLLTISSDFIPAMFNARRRCHALSRLTRTFFVMYLQCKTITPLCCALRSLLHAFLFGLLATLRMTRLVARGRLDSGRLYYR